MQNGKHFRPDRQTERFRVKAALTGLCLGLSACAMAAGEEPAGGFVDLAEILPGLSLEMRYFGEDNFVGRPIAGYEVEKCLVTPEAAEALKSVQADLSITGLGLKAFDCYRPARAVADFVQWARDSNDIKMKAIYYPDIAKPDLFKLGYLAEKSGHSRGSTIDVTIMDMASGEALDMGSGYDLFDPLSWPSDPRPDAQQRSNRALLRAVMTRHGFKPLKEEWWHFTLEDEPYPDTYFDVPVK